MSDLSDERLAILAKTGSGDVRDLVAEIERLRKVDRIRRRATKVLLRDVVFDYGYVCDVPECTCSMNAAKRLVESEDEESN